MHSFLDLIFVLAMFHHVDNVWQLILVNLHIVELTKVNNLSLHFFGSWGISMLCLSDHLTVPKPEASTRVTWLGLESSFALWLWLLLDYLSAFWYCFTWFQRICKGPRCMYWCGGLTIKQISNIKLLDKHLASTPRTYRQSSTPRINSFPFI